MLELRSSHGALPALPTQVFVLSCRASAKAVEGTYFTVSYILHLFVELITLKEVSPTLQHLRQGEVMTSASAFVTHTIIRTLSHTAFTD